MKLWVLRPVTALESSWRRARSRQRAEQVEAAIDIEALGWFAIVALVGLEVTALLLMVLPRGTTLFLATVCLGTLSAAIFLLSFAAYFALELGSHTISRREIVVAARVLTGRGE